jgi:hypothetical protein
MGFIEALPWFVVAALGIVLVGPLVFAWVFLVAWLAAALLNAVRAVVGTFALLLPDAWREWLVREGVALKVG